MNERLKGCLPIIIFCVLFWVGAYYGLKWCINQMVEASVQMHMVVINDNVHKFQVKVVEIDAEQQRLKKDIDTYRPTSQVSGMSRTQMIVKAYTCIDDDKRPGDPTYCITKDGTRLTKEHYYKIVAVKPGKYPLGTWLRLTHVNGGYITKVRVADWGDLKENELDLFIHENDRQSALHWGNQKFNVTVVE